MTIETAGSVHIFVFLFSEFVLPKLNLQARPIICNVTLTTDCNLIFTSNVLYATSAVFFSSLDACDRPTSVATCNDAAAHSHMKWLTFPVEIESLP